MHKRERVPIAMLRGTASTGTEEEGLELQLHAQIKQELAAFEEETFPHYVNPTMYADLVRREIRIFRALNGFYKPGFEGRAFPELFPFGQGFFDAERKRPFRFKEYRQRIIVQCEGQFFRSDKWFNWSAMIEELIEQALINELATERDRARHPQACVDKQPRVNRLARLNRRIGASLLSR